MQRDCYSEIVEQFEKQVALLVKIYSKEDIQHQHDTDLNAKLTRYLKLNFPLAYAEKPGQSSVIEKPERTSQVGSEATEESKFNLQRGMSMEQSSNQVSGAKNMKIPPLRLPSNNNETGPLARSTHRADQFKSISSNSNRFSHSIDSTFKERVNLPTKSENQEDNQSKVDIESVHEPVPPNPKRRLQIDCLQGLDNTNIPEVIKWCKEENGKTYDRYENPSSLRRKERLEQHNEDDTVTDSVDIKITENLAPQEKNKLSKYNDLIHQAKICRKWANLLYQNASQLDPKQLQYEFSPVYAIYSYLSTELSARLRYKDQLRMLYSRRQHNFFSVTKYQDRLNFLCDGEFIDEDENLKPTEPKVQLKLIKQHQRPNQDPYFSRVPKDEKRESHNDIHQIESYINNQADQNEDQSIFFKILNLYQKITEMNHSKLCAHAFKETVRDDDYETERSLESPLSFNLPELIQPIRSTIDQRDIVVNSRHVKINALPKSSDVTIKQLDPFLNYFEKRFTNLLLKMDLQKAEYYQMQIDQLGILDSYLAYSTSRILVPQIVDYFLNILLMIKRQLIEITNCQLCTNDGQGSNSMRFKTPAQSQSKSTKNYNQTISNMFKPVTMVEVSKQLESPDKRLTPSDNPTYFKHYNPIQTMIPRPQSSQQSSMMPSKQRLSMSVTQIAAPNHQVFVLCYPDLMGVYLSIIARLMLKSLKPEAMKLLMSVYLCSDTFVELLRFYVTNLFSEISLDKKINKKPPNGRLNVSTSQQNLSLTPDQANIYMNVLRVLFYFESIFVLIQNMINLKDKQEKEIKSNIRKVLNNVYFFFKPQGGVLPIFIEENYSLINEILSHNDKHKVPMVTALQFQVYRKSFNVLSGYFSFDNSLNPALVNHDDIAGYYIRTCFQYFTKLYSLENDHEMKLINQKIQELKQQKDINKFNSQISAAADIQTKSNEYYRYYSVSLMNTFIKCLFSLACSRSEEITKKFLQNRIVEYLTAEIDLEYDVTQTRDRFEQHSKSNKNLHDESQLDNPSELSNRSSERDLKNPEKYRRGPVKAPVLFNSQPIMKDNLAEINEEEQEDIDNYNTLGAVPKWLGEEEEKKRKKTHKTPISQNLLKKVLVPKLELNIEKNKGIIYQSYSHSPQFNMNLSVITKPVQNLTAMIKNSPSDALESKNNSGTQDVSQNHKRGCSMIMKTDLLKQSIIPNNIVQRQPKPPSFQIPLIQLQKEQKDFSKVPKLNLNGFQSPVQITSPIQQSMQVDDSVNKSGQKKSLNLDIKKLPQFQPKQTNQPTTSANPNENVLYHIERRLRKIYSDRELHANIISLLITLLLTPDRGTLDDHYCSQNPYINGKPNILFLLHHHLNHPLNESIIPLVQSKISAIKVLASGQRLLKLLCRCLFDVGQYTDWVKLASGGYGVIYECKTGLEDPPIVAIKQLEMKKSIYESSSIYTIFNEITCLEMFKLQKNVVKLYDYGVTDNDYILVMKKYPCSLKEWRSKQKGGINENLAHYLNIYKDVLNAVKMLHDNRVVHYDIKADNILLDFELNRFGSASEEMNIVLADFGECHIFNSEEDEHSLKSRGTECNQSPEMLTLTISTKKEADHYDRRKKVGTTRVSDVWSLGCLLFEILSGEHLFHNPDWVQFYIRVTSINETLITEDKIQQMGSSIYLLDFLKYILVRDQKHRPNIDTVLKRFEHVHALLITNSNPVTASYSPIVQSSVNSPRIQRNTFDQMVQQYHKLVFTQAQIQIDNPSSRKRKVTKCLNQTTHCIRLLNEVFLCSKSFFMQNRDRLIIMGITNVVSDTCVLKTQQLQRFQYLLFSIERITQVNSAQKAAQITPYLLDYLKVMILNKGKILIVENDIQQENQDSIRLSLIFCLSSFFKIPVFETVTMLNCQNLFLHISHLKEMSVFSANQQMISSHLNTYPKLQCLCECSILVLKRDYNDERHIQIEQCRCTGKMMCLGGAQDSSGCLNFMKMLRRRYRLSWEAVRWGYMNSKSFLIGPFNQGIQTSYNEGLISSETHIQLILSSMGPNHSIIRSQASYRDHSEVTNQIDQSSYDWSLYECKFCNMWMFAHNRQTDQFIVVMNNLTKRNRKGIIGHETVIMPVFKNFKLNEIK